MVDKFHARAHKCSLALRMLASLSFRNTSVVEQFNRMLSDIASSLRSMKPANAMQLLRLFAIVHNWHFNKIVERRMSTAAKNALHVAFAAAAEVLAGK